jgi:Flp pilus assembly protein CpaB
MTQLIFKNDIDQNKMDVLLSMVKSWNIETSVVTVTPRKNRRNKNTALTLSVGLWAGRDIDDKQLREQAWGTSKRLRK